MAGYPGTIAATWQRAGRAGRRTTRSAAVLVASSAPIDQFIIRNPSYFFDASPEHALINPDNLHILLDHVKCAAFELPFSIDEQFCHEGQRDQVDVQQILSVLAEEGFVHAADGQWNWTHESYPADAVSLRSVSSDNFVVVDIDARRARDRRDRLHQRAGDAAREGDLPGRRAAVPGREAGFRWPQGLRPQRRLRLLHGRDHVYEGDDPGYVSRSDDASVGGSMAERRTMPSSGRIRGPRDLVHRRRRRGPTARSTSSPASSDSRRSSSTRTRTSDRASSICRSSRCTRRRTG